MSFRFFKRVNVVPGLRVNLSRSGPSLSVGTKGAWWTIGRRGQRVSVDAVGTGVGWYEQIPWTTRRAGQCVWK